jgi:threonine dehydratase
MAVVRAGAAGLVRVDDEGIREAVRLIYRASHNVAEGAGAAALAALMADRKRHRGQRVGVVLTGGNISAGRLVEILA